MPRYSSADLVSSVGVAPSLPCFPRSSGVDTRPWRSTDRRCVGSEGGMPFTPLTSLGQTERESLTRGGGTAAPEPLEDG